jgi:hypothetical protein
MKHCVAYSPMKCNDINLKKCHNSNRHVDTKIKLISKKITKDVCISRLSDLTVIKHLKSSNQNAVFIGYDVLIESILSSSTKLNA